ncbi:O-antigen ligase domain-containing protein [Pseudomonas sp. v388]|uniref:O-antigen ligase family protein n=1 Tax=Pseudomonas sp. v388 TaxID=2479849 RepID=UPI000F7891D0|nr:O-antigen ligase family protein [Pseudomonas sp. v388]RRV09441.1 O-antigen ligase domain-containing protein [Pseudomonas sp. v388]
MSFDRTGFAGSKVSIYFSAALIVFLLSYILNPSAKVTNNLFYALIALPGLFFMLKHRGAGVLGQPLGVAWAVFMAWFLAPALVAGEFQFYKHILYVSLFVCVVGGLVSNEFFRSSPFIRGQFWTVCLYILAVSVYGWSTGQFALGERVNLLPARMENVIYASGWLVCCLALALPVWVRERRWVEAGCAVFVTLLVAAFIVQTRTALVGAAFLFGVCALYSLYRSPKRSVPVLLALAAVAALGFWVVKDEQWIQLLLVRGDSYRIELFQIMTGEWRNCGWLLGCGVEFHTDQTLTGGMPIQHPHSIFVSMGLYTGAVSLVLFLVVMAATLWNAVRLREGWGLYLACALVMLNFDGAKLIGNPDELWVLVLLPAAMVLGRVVQSRRRL